MQDDRDQTIKTLPDSIQSLAGLPRRYENKGIIGQGGMGMVFRAYDLQLERDVAVKVLLFEGSRDTELQERFNREAKILATLDHVNIVRILAWGVNDSGNPFQVMEFIDGATLASEIGKGKRLRPARFHEVFSGVLAGLDHAHNRGIVHRDIKPSNIIICPPGEETCAKIVDFGIARRQQARGTETGSTLTQTGHMLGSPTYMSPEQCKAAKIDHLSDLYSLACVMFEALIGDPPHQAESPLELMYKHMMVPAPSLETVASGLTSKRLGKLVDRCLCKDPQERPQTASEVLAELNQIFEEKLDTRTIFAADLSKSPTLKFPLLAAGTVVLVILAAIIISAFQHEQARKQAQAIDPAKKSIESQENLRKDLEKLYQQSRSITQKHSRADHLVKLLLKLAKAQHIAHDDKSADSTLNAARKYALDSKDADGNTAEMFLARANCKFEIIEYNAAEKAFEDGLASIPRDSSGAIMQPDHTGIATKLAEGLAILHIKEKRFESASKDVAVLIGSEYKQSFIERDLSKGFGGGYAPQGPPLIRNISAKLAAVALNGPQEEMGALKLYNQLFDYQLAQFSDYQESAGIEQTQERMQKLLQIIPPDTPEFKPLATRANKSFAKLEEFNHSNEAAVKHRQKTES